jgi:hypothetical protein
MTEHDHDHGEPQTIEEHVVTPYHMDYSDPAIREADIAIDVDGRLFDIVTDLPCERHEAYGELVGHIEAVRCWMRQKGLMIRPPADPRGRLEERVYAGLERMDQQTRNAVLDDYGWRVGVEGDPAAFLARLSTDHLLRIAEEIAEGEELVIIHRVRPRA